MVSNSGQKNYAVPMKLFFSLVLGSLLLTSCGQSEQLSSADEGPISVTQMVGTVDSWSRKGSNVIQVTFTVRNESQKTQSVTEAGCFISAFDSNGDYYGKFVAGGTTDTSKRTTLNPGEAYSDIANVFIHNLQTGDRGGSEFVDKVFVICD